MNRNGKGCKFCYSHDGLRLVDEERGSRRFRIAYCPGCYAAFEAWELVADHDHDRLIRVSVDVLLSPALTMLDLGEVIAPGKRSSDPLDLEAYSIDDGAQVAGLPLQAPLKVS